MLALTQTKPNKKSKTSFILPQYPTPARSENALYGDVSESGKENQVHSLNDRPLIFFSSMMQREKSEIDVCPKRDSEIMHRH